MKTKDLAQDLWKKLFALRDEREWAYFVLMVEADDGCQWVDVWVEFEHNEKDYRYHCRAHYCDIFEEEETYTVFSMDIINRIKRDMAKEKTGEEITMEFN